MGNNLENTKRRLVEYGHANLVDDVKEKALLSKGRMFTFSFNVVTEVLRFERRVSSFGERWKQISSTPTADYSLYQRDQVLLRQKGYRGITYHEEHNSLIYDQRPEARIYRSFIPTPFCNVGYVVNVSVDVPTSKAIYEEILSAATSFKDYLLNQKPEILEALSRVKIVSKPEDGQYAYYIHSSGIYCSPPDASWSEKCVIVSPVPALRFEEIGLKSLKEIEKRYGLGLALIEYVQSKNADYFKNYFSYSDSVVPCGDESDYVIKVSLKKEIEPKVLQEW